MDWIDIQNASENNLKNVSLRIPRDSLVVITGLSGSGKSSLAFDTIFAEARRRYMDTLSSYARYYIGTMERPAVESIDGLSPTISIEQKSVNRNPRSTVGTITEISDFLRLLYSKAAVAYSPSTGKPMVRYSDEEIVDLIMDNYKGRKSIILAPLVRGRKGNYKDLFESLVKKGFNTVFADGQFRQIVDLVEDGLDRYKVHFIDLVIDKIIPKDSDFKRVSDSIVTALQYGKGSLAIYDLEKQTTKYLSKHYVCEETGDSLPEPAPHTFSFNSPQGACPRCNGLGVVTDVDIDMIIPDKSISIADGAILPLGPKRPNKFFEMLEATAKKYGFSLYEPIGTLSPEALGIVMSGSADLVRVNYSNGVSEMVAFPGVCSKIEKGEQDEDEGTFNGRYSSEKVCPLCNGSRLRRESLYFKIDGKDIAQVCDMDINELYDWIVSLPSRLETRENIIAQDILKELRERISFLMDVGLSYLSLNRATRTLSGGESQRIRLATQIGSKLVNVLYILDEPSIGLHQSDNIKLINSLKKLRDEGNTVMVVEHDEEMMRNADWLVDIGPGAGEKGGRILFNAPPDTPVPADYEGYTFKYLNGLKKIGVPTIRRPGNGRFIRLEGACGNNLRNISINIPLGCMVGISGVSGSGKSSLIDDTLVPIISNHLYRSLYPILPYGSISGIENIDKLIEVDQSPIGRSPRSNPATYTGVLTHIRKLFVETPDAKIRGFKPNHFSFNVKGGRCECCKGAGVEIIEMNFLPSVQVKCKECNGRRFKPAILDVKYKGASISDVLEMTVSQAHEFFSNIPVIEPKLRALVDVGLGYIRLGQSSLSLSGGENQRVKLASELSKSATGNSLFILDEPTTGLHYEDVNVLLGVLQRLVNQGNTVIVIEHNLDVLKCCDYIFDMGPGGGRAGGMIVAQGTPEEVALNPDSVTGKYLLPMLYN
ncbi:MAG: excinuclease ABC subunit UvrA [Bacteroidales bacterium]|nr:excinuclease ABC subunit UvrA [Bacteroidales bacterium]